MAEPPTPELDTDALPPTAIARVEQADVSLGWPYVLVPGTLSSWPRVNADGADENPLARRVIGCFGLVLGGSAGLCVGGLGAALLAALLHPLLPHIAELLLLSVTLFSVALGATVGRRVLHRETFE